MKSLLLALSLALAGPPPVDAGLSTAVTGTVVLQGAAQSQTTAVVPFMKLRVGDAVSLPSGAHLQVVFFDTGRRETWTGPAELVIGAGASELREGEPPQVEQTAPELGESLETLPILLVRAERDRAGQAVVRGEEAPVDPRSQLDPVEQAELDVAKNRYEILRASLPAEDVLADVYYATVLRAHGLDGEANEVLAAARKRCGECALPFEP